MILYLIEIRPNPAALVQFCRDQDITPERGDKDFGYGLHAWLKAAFGTLAPQPWRWLGQPGGSGRLLGYALQDASALRNHLRQFADPGAYRVCPDPDTQCRSKPLPAWRRGMVLGFEVLVTPVARQARTGIEKDLFLIEADHHPDVPLDRARIYAAWVQAQLERTQAVQVTAIRLAGFRLTQQLRRAQREGQRPARKLLRPQAQLTGTLTIRDPDAFTALLARGIGRHRAFGYGMLLLRPPS